MKHLNRVAIVGVGLIGGSVGLALRQRGWPARSWASAAGRLGCGSPAASGPSPIPPSIWPKALPRPIWWSSARPWATSSSRSAQSPALLPGRDAHHRCRQHESRRSWRPLMKGSGRGCRFLGSHPLAGSEKTGASHAAADLFDGRVAIITPTQEHAGRRFRPARGILGSRSARSSCGCRPKSTIGRWPSTSHLPHLAAAALAATVPESIFPLGRHRHLGQPRGWPAAIRSSGNKSSCKTARTSWPPWSNMGRSCRPCTPPLRDGNEAELERILTTAKKNRMLWEVDIHPADGQPDMLGRASGRAGRRIGFGRSADRRRRPRLLIQGAARSRQVERIARELLADRVVERTVVAAAGEAALIEPPPGRDPSPPQWRRQWHVQLVHVLPKPGVMDPVAQSVLSAIADFGIRAEAVRTLKKYWIGGLPDGAARLLCRQGPGQRRHRAGDRRAAAVRPPGSGLALRVPPATVPIRPMDDAALERSEPRRAALSVAGRDADDPGPFSRARPRPDRRRTGNHRPDLERALQPQDAGRADPLSRRRGSSGISRTCSARRSSPPREKIRRDGRRRPTGA